MEDRRIVLIGYRGTGKSSIGRELAQLLNLQHIDLDSLIEEKEGRTISQIFADEGEDKFREIESGILNKVSQSPLVLSTGGGAVIRTDNIRALRRKSIIILLTSDEKVIARRISGTTRPSLTGRPLAEEIHDVLADRMPNYRSAADFVLDTTGKRPAEAAQELKNLIKPDAVRSIQSENRRTLITWIKKNPIPVAALTPLEETLNDSNMRLYGILGNPSMHSLSPPLWNRLFEVLEIPARYTWFECPHPAQFISLAEKAGVRGLSVTIPHKETIIPLLDDVRHDAQVIGAVNTVLLQDGKRFGFNTDWKGIYRPLEGIEGETAVILGAGGAAASAVYAVSMRGFYPIVLNRTVDRAVDLARRFGAESGPLSLFPELDADLVINATSVGMGKTHLENATIPIPTSSLKSHMHIFDLVYTPAETPLLRAALDKGCSVIPGTEMFIHQLVEQFRVLTGIDVQADTIREWLF
ncbi:MAG TPA: shikimate kinase [Methanospirillum sp.]|nr:shikimate kinase [Methanospirillum sp.]